MNHIAHNSVLWLLTSHSQISKQWRKQNNLLPNRRQLSFLVKRYAKSLTSVFPNSQESLHPSLGDVHSLFVQAQSCHHIV